MPRVLSHMRKYNAKGTLVVPQWFSASFWPLLCTQGTFIKEVTDLVYLPCVKEAYVPSRIEGGFFGVSDLKFSMLALKLDYIK